VLEFLECESLPLFPAVLASNKSLYHVLGVGCL